MNLHKLTTEITNIPLLDGFKVNFRNGIDMIRIAVKWHSIEDEFSLSLYKPRQLQVVAWSAGLNTIQMRTRSTLNSLRLLPRRLFAGIVFARRALCIYQRLTQLFCYTNFFNYFMRLDRFNSFADVTKKILIIVNNIYVFFMIQFYYIYIYVCYLLLWRNDFIVTCVSLHVVVSIFLILSVAVKKSI